MTEQDPEAAPGTSSGQDSTSFTAVCESKHGLQGQWLGPIRPDFDTAQADADDHNRKNPGHEASVI